MIFNCEKMHPQTNIDCLSCKFFDKKLKKCKGRGKVCFEYDPKTMTIIDPTTGLPLKKVEVDNAS